MGVDISLRILASVSLCAICTGSHPQYLALSPIFGPSNQLFAFLNSLAIALEYNRTHAVFAPLRPHRPWIEKCIQRAPRSQCMSDTYTMTPHLYLNTDDNIVKSRVSYIMPNGKLSTASTKPMYLTLCSAYGTARELDRLTKNSTIVSKMLSTIKIIIGTGDPEVAARAEVSYASLQQWGVEIKESKFQELQCIHEALERGKSVVVITFDHDICSSAYEFNLTRYQHSSPTPCPQLKTVLDRGQTMFSYNLKPILSNRYSQDDVSSLLRWTSKAVAIHLRIPDAERFETPNRRTQLSVADNTSNIKNTFDGSMWAFSLEKCGVLTLLDFINAIARSVISGPFSNRLLFISNSEALTQLMLSSMAERAIDARTADEVIMKRAGDKSVNWNPVKFEWVVRVSAASSKWFVFDSKSSFSNSIYYMRSGKSSLSILDFVNCKDAFKCNSLLVQHGKNYGGEATAKGKRKLKVDFLVFRIMKGLVNEIVAECNPMDLLPKDSNSKFNLREWIHVPYFPAFHQPGWMLRYGLGPFDEKWAEMFFADMQAGMTVLLTLIPQALSQATLANMPPIFGLYTSLIPSATYAFFGSSMQLCVGPTALISLLTGSILTKYGVDAEEDLELAIDTAAQAAFCCGLIISICGLLNLGNMINFMSHPVMSGFTCGAALIIGMTQLRSAFGFSLVPPQVGKDAEYNYEVVEWWIENFNGHDDKGHTYRNHYAVKICFGLYVPLMCVQLIKWNYKFSNAQKKTVAYKIWNLITTLLPLAAIIIGAHVAYMIKKNDHFNEKGYTHSYYAKKLKIVGEIPPGLNILRIPRFRHPFGPFIAEVFPLTLIAFMESYSIARSMAAASNQLNMLSASQEMFANGAANLVACVSSAYPVSGSFSRSALNGSVGAKTPMSLCAQIVGVIICLSALTKALEYVPSAALSAIIFVAIANLLNFSDLWHAWKYSKKDFFTMVVTTATVFLFDTSIGLAIGLFTSVLVYCVFDIIFAKSHSPRLFSSSKDGNDVDVVRVESDLNFLTSARVKDFIAALVLETPVEPAVTNRSEFIRYQISHLFDSLLKPNLLAGVSKLPKAIVVDLCIVKTIDMSGMEALAGISSEVRGKGVLIAFINCAPDILAKLNDYGIKSDKSTPEVNFEEYEVAYRLDLWSIQDKSLSRRGRTVSRDVIVAAELFSEVEIPTVADNVSEHHVPRKISADLETGLYRDESESFLGIELGQMVERNVPSERSHKLE